MPLEKKSRELVGRDAFLNLVRAHEALVLEFETLFRAHDLTFTQYNVLRIVLGAGPEGASCQHLATNLLNRVPDVTRLIDRMVGAGLVKRSRSLSDRRVVLTKATARGKKLCDDLFDAVMQIHKNQFAHLPFHELKGLHDTLEDLVARQETRMTQGAEW